MGVTHVLGVNAFHGDAAAVLLRDGIVVAAIEEERLRRIKHCAGFPSQAIAECLRLGGVDAADVDVFAVSRRPSAHLWRKALWAVSHPAARSLVDRGRNALRVRSFAEVLAAGLALPPAHVRTRLVHVEHHSAHLASAACVGPFEESAVCAIDGFGDFVSTSWGHSCQGVVRVDRRVYFPHSLGLLYLAVTQFLGFGRYGDEFKVMGLAPYGEPRFVQAIRSLVRLEDRGAFRLDLSYFTHWNRGVAMTWDDGEPVVGATFSPKLAELLGPARDASEPLTDRHEAIAASLQVVFEDAVMHVLRAVQRATRQRHLCLAGGCAMNSVANGKIRSRTEFTDVFVQPAAGDSGTALGAALIADRQQRPVGAEAGARGQWVMDHGYWGPSFTDVAIARVVTDAREPIAQAGATSRTIEPVEALVGWTANQLAAGRIVGWFQGRMEWGARALGNRSILADPRRADMREIINTRIKLRERFRPFAPSILEEALDDYFIDAKPDPFMLQVYPIRPDQRRRIPAVTHVDGSGRVQTVNRAQNPLYWSLIRAFADRTGVPVLLNTSFNENEPIVLNPQQALDCFLRTHMDVIVLGSHVIERLVAG
jgi:carbamoyltransferase